MATLKSWLRNNWDEALVYGLTLWCTIIAPYLPILTEGRKMAFTFDALAFAVYATVALFLTYVQEFIRKEKDETAETTAKKRAAKRTHMVRRITFAMFFGFSSPLILPSVFQYFMRALGLGE